MLDAELPDDVAAQLAARGITARDEIALRLELERHAPSYTLFRLNPIASRKWRARYRIMLAADFIDCQTVIEAYARALLACLAASDTTPEEP